MSLSDVLTVAAYQGPLAEGDVQANLAKVFELMSVAESRDIDILCLPETFLHGYFTKKELALKHSLDLRSSEFATLCQLFVPFKKTTLLLGLNEREDDQLYNTVVIIEAGKCIGKYRKAYTYAPYDYFSVGRDFPVFEKKGVKYGVIICLDSVYREPALITALNGARIIFCPMHNRIPQDARMLLYLQRKSHFIARAYDNQCWLVASDIVWDSPKEICPGYACILNDCGEVITKSEPFQEGLLTYSIPLKNLKEVKNNQLFGEPELFDLIISSYKDALKSEPK